MTKVVFQDKGYWLNEQFWEDAEQTLKPVSIATYRHGKLHDEVVTRAMIDQAFSGKIAGWVTCEHKSISVFQASLRPLNQVALVCHYNAAILTALTTVAPLFIARTGAQGKTRKAAEPTFYYAVHLESKYGQPHLHCHIGVSDQVKVPSEGKAYATHKVQLYQLRPLFMAALQHEFGYRLHHEYRVRVQRSEQGLILPDVPKALCEASSKRKEQIDQYLSEKNVPNTPRARIFGAMATRRWNEDPRIGRQEFESKRKELGFRGEEISCCIALETSKQIKKIARSLTINLGSIPERITPEVRAECLLRVMGKAPLCIDGVMVRQIVDRAIARSVQQSLSTTVENNYQAQSEWLAVIERAQKLLKPEHSQIRPESETPVAKSPIVRRDATPRESPEPSQQKISRRSQEQSSGSKQNGSHSTGSQHNGFHQSQERTQSQSTEQSQRSQEQARKLLRQLWQSTRVVGAIGAAGIAFAKKTIELYQEYSKPIWRMEGRGTRTQPGCVAHAVRNLKPQSRWESHMTAVRAMVRLNGTLEQKLAYGEHVYRQCRRPKFKISKKSLVVIRDVGSAFPSDVTFILKKAKQAKARVLLVDREWSRRELVNFAKKAPPGQATRIPPPTMGH